MRREVLKVLFEEEYKKMLEEGAWEKLAALCDKADKKYDAGGSLESFPVDKCGHPSNLRSPDEQKYKAMAKGQSVDYPGYPVTAAADCPPGEIKSPDTGKCTRPLETEPPVQAAAASEKLPASGTIPRKTRRFRDPAKRLPRQGWLSRLGIQEQKQLQRWKVLAGV